MKTLIKLILNRSLARYYVKGVSFSINKHGLYVRTYMYLFYYEIAAFYTHEKFKDIKMHAKTRNIGRKLY